ncbi:hypothetical protein L596_027390 [Steinernema carpocapsae]|uniref:Uncharacterized protein n=1 Tax=Steinernema carpocapsae TaxID=34508 RepID=A0A4U5M461_STECR|nr:hypothetical protein L596_027390 [Steinernema carpocapsae]
MKYDMSVIHPSPSPAPIIASPRAWLRASRCRKIRQNSLLFVSFLAASLTFPRLSRRSLVVVCCPSLLQRANDNA